MDFEPRYLELEPFIAERHSSYLPARIFTKLGGGDDSLSIEQGEVSSRIRSCTTAGFELKPQQGIASLQQTVSRLQSLAAGLHFSRLLFIRGLGISRETFLVAALGEGCQESKPPFAGVLVPS